MIPAEASASSQPDAQKMRKVAVLAAVSPVEARAFFPDPLWSQVQDVASHWMSVDPRGLATDDLARVLAAHGAEIMIACWKTPPLPAVLPRELRYVCYLAGSVKRLVARDQLEGGLLVSNWGDSISRVVAEGALLHILGCLRRSSAWSILMHHHGGWKDDQTETASLFGRSVGLHGFGRIARELVRLLRPFDVRIGVFAPDITAAVESEWNVRRVESLPALFSDHDVIVELAPLVAATRGIVDESLLRLIRPGGVFVNVARGALVDEAALVRVAREGRVQFGLDVFTTEPLPGDHPLRGLTNVSLTPHLAGPTTDRCRDAGAWALRNLRAYLAGDTVGARITAGMLDHMT